MYNFTSSLGTKTGGMWYHDCMGQDDLSLVCVVVCPDCDATVVLDTEFVSVFIGFGEIVAISLCGYCERPVSCSIDVDFARELADLGVKVLSWETGLEVTIKEMKKLK